MLSKHKRDVATLQLAEDALSGIDYATIHNVLRDWGCEYTGRDVDTVMNNLRSRLRVTLEDC